MADDARDMHPTPEDPPQRLHDGFVRHVLRHPEAAAVELRAALPAALVERLDWSTIHVEDASFVDPQLRPRQSDILYTIRTKTSGTPVLIYVLLEHQSTVDRLMAWRFHRYVTRIWEHYERTHEGIDALPLVIPLLLFQGPGGWTAPRRLSELIAVPPELATTLDPPVELVFAIDDLHRVIEHDPLAREEVVAYVEATRTLLFFAVRPDPSEPDPSTPHRLTMLSSRISAVHVRLGHEAAQTLLYYLTHAFRYRSRLHAMILEPIEEETRKMYDDYQEELRAGAIAVMQEQLIDEAREQGLEQGLEQGMLTFLTGLLDARGLLDDSTRTRLHQQRHDAARLQQWFERALVATSAAEVFDPP